MMDSTMYMNMPQIWDPDSDSDPYLGPGTLLIEEEEEKEQKKKAWKLGTMYMVMLLPYWLLTGCKLHTYCV